MKNPALPLLLDMLPQRWLQGTACPGRRPGRVARSEAALAA